MAINYTRVNYGLIITIGLIVHSIDGCIQHSSASTARNQFYRVRLTARLFAWSWLQFAAPFNRLNVYMPRGSILACFTCARIFHAGGQQLKWRRQTQDVRLSEFKCIEKVHRQMGQVLVGLMANALLWLTVSHSQWPCKRIGAEWTQLLWY